MYPNPPGGDSTPRSGLGPKDNVRTSPGKVQRLAQGWTPRSQDHGVRHSESTPVPTGANHEQRGAEVTRSCGSVSSQSLLWVCPVPEKTRVSKECLHHGGGVGASSVRSPSFLPLRRTLGWVGSGHRPRFPGGGVGTPSRPALRPPPRRPTVSGSSEP